MWGERSLTGIIAVASTCGVTFQAGSSEMLGMMQAVVSKLQWQKDMPLGPQVRSVPGASAGQQLFPETMPGAACWQWWHPPGCIAAAAKVPQGSTNTAQASTAIIRHRELSDLCTKL